MAAEAACYQNEESRGVVLQQFHRGAAALRLDRFSRRDGEVSAGAARGGRKIARVREDKGRRRKDKKEIKGGAR